MGPTTRGQFWERVVEGVVLDIPLLSYPGTELSATVHTYVGKHNRKLQVITVNKDGETIANLTLNATPDELTTTKLVELPMIINTVVHPYTSKEFLYPSLLAAIVTALDNYGIKVNKSEAENIIALKLLEVLASFQRINVLKELSYEHGYSLETILCQDEDRAPSLRFKFNKIIDNNTFNIEVSFGDAIETNKASINLRYLEDHKLLSLFGGEFFTVFNKICEDIRSKFLEHVSDIKEVQEVNNGTNKLIELKTVLELYRKLEVACDNLDNGKIEHGVKLNEYGDVELLLRTVGNPAITTHTLAYNNLNQLRRCGFMYSPAQVHAFYSIDLDSLLKLSDSELQDYVKMVRDAIIYSSGYNSKIYNNAVTPQQIGCAVRRY